MKNAFQLALIVLVILLGQLLHWPLAASLLLLLAVTIGTLLWISADRDGGKR